MPQWLGVAPWLFLFSSFSTDYSSAFPSQQQHELQSNLLQQSLLQAQTHRIPQGPAPLEKHHKTQISIPPALQQEEFPSLLLLLKEKGAESSLLVPVGGKCKHCSTPEALDSPQGTALGGGTAGESLCGDFGVTPGVSPHLEESPAAQGAG